MQRRLVVAHEKRVLKDKTGLQKHQPLLLCSCVEAEAEADAKKRKDFAFRRHVNDKPSSKQGCPGKEMQTGSACLGVLCLPEPYAS